MFVLLYYAGISWKFLEISNETTTVASVSDEDMILAYVTSWTRIVDVIVRRPTAEKYVI